MLHKHGTSPPQWHPGLGRQTLDLRTIILEVGKGTGKVLGRATPLGCQGLLALFSAPQDNMEGRSHEAGKELIPWLSSCSGSHFRSLFRYIKVHLLQWQNVSIYVLSSKFLIPTSGMF